MNSRSIPAHRVVGRVLFLLMALPVAQAWAQNGDASPKPLTIDDYSRWRRIEDARISSDGRWVAYTLRHTNTLSHESKPELRIRDLETDRDIVVPMAHDGEFSPDARWIKYEIDSIPAPDRTDDSTSADSSEAPTGSPPRVELRELRTGRTQSWERIQSASFNMLSTHLMLRHRAQPDGDEDPRGVDVLLHDLATARGLLLGNVGDASFNRQGDLLAYSVDAAVRTGNGLFVMDLAESRIEILENDTLIYSQIEWSDDGEGLAALKGLPVKKMRERDNTLITFADLRGSLDDNESGAVTLDRWAHGFPEGFVISERASLSWSEDGRRVFFGIIPQTLAPDSADRPGRDSVANVDVWRTQDERIQSVQMIQADRERNFTFRQAFDAMDGRYITLTDSAMRAVEIATDGRWAVGRDVQAYISDTAAARADLYRVNTATGERTLMMQGQLTGQHVFGITPDGKRYVYWDNNRFHAYDLDAGDSRTIPGGENDEFLNKEFDYTRTRPSYGVEGYTSDGSGVIVRQRYDLWLLPFDNGTPRNLTGGEGQELDVRFRYVRTEPIDSAAPRRTRSGREIDLSKPVTLSAYGQWTKKSGFYRLDGGELEELVYDDARFSTPIRAETADRFLLTRQTFVEFPDLQVSSGKLADMEKISDANPQQAEYMW